MNDNIAQSEAQSPDCKNSGAAPCYNTVECDICNAVFVPGGKDNTSVCAGCYRDKNVYLKQKNRQMAAALEILHAVSVLEYHDKNWLNIKVAKSPGEFERDKQLLVERAFAV